MRVHGGNIYQKSEMLDFSANINPLGMPQSVRRAIIESAAECTHYPDPDCTALILKLSEYEYFPGEQIVCGNGAADLIYRIAFAFKPRHALICAPTFSEYAFALQSTGCLISEYMLDSARSFRLDEQILSMITNEIDMVILCTPNNPTGQRIEPDLLKQISECCYQNHVILVCDECFLGFSENAEAYSLHQCFHEYCIILNAFTKLYAMPGLRLGYALCGSVQNAALLQRTGQCWSVSVPAQAAGISALDEKEWIADTVRYVHTEREYLEKALRSLGIFVYESSANFIMIKAPESFADEMEKHGILVRRCDDFHNLDSGHFRIAVRTHTENAALISAINEVYQ